MNNGLQALSAKDFAALADTQNALILDTRNNADFAKAFIPQSINIGLKGDFAPWVGALIADVAQPILLVTEIGQEEEAVTRLARVGFDNQLGYLEGGFQAWLDANETTDAVNRISAEQFINEIENSKNKILDIRKENEFNTNHIEDADNYPLAAINDWIKDINPSEHFYMHCAGGYRSMIAASILQARGYRNFTEIAGGFGAISRVIEIGTRI